MSTSGNQLDKPIALKAHRYISTSAQHRNRFGADQIAKHIAAVHERKEICVLALVGGSSVAGVHTELIEQRDIDWSRVLITHGDERVVPLDSPERNWHVASELVEALISSGRITESNLVTLADIDSDADDVEIRAKLDPMSERVKSIDVALLGMGEDGHIASLFPNHKSLEQCEDTVFTIVRDSPKPPPVRIGVTFDALSTARLVVIGFGDGKADALAEVVQDGSIRDLPARIVHLNPESVLITDR